MAKRKNNPRQLRPLRYLLYFALTVVAISVMLVLPLRWVNPATTAFMLQDDSGRIPVDWQWRDWNELGNHAALAVVASEDQKFATHFGFDLTSIQSSVDEFKSGERLRGASTISQQLSKNLFLWRGRSFARKGIEAWFTVVMEVCLPKQRILEIYLNVVELGPGVYGFEAGSKAHFGKPAAALRGDEAALLAAVLPNPSRLNASRPSDYVRERQRWILSQMARLQREGWLTVLD